MKGRNSQRPRRVRRRRRQRPRRMSGCRELPSGSRWRRKRRSHGGLAASKRRRKL